MIVIDKWPGLVTNASPYSLPAGAAVTQVNLQVLSPGQMTVRPGLQLVTFTTHSAGASPIVSAFRYERNAQEYIVYQDANGLIRVARGPT